MDVDFPAVYREEAGLDSLLQAAGRCNREGKRKPEESVVTLFQGEGRPPRLFETAIGAGRMVLERFEDIGSREAVHAYFSALLDLKGEEAQDIHGILPLMESEFFPFRAVSERFHLIDSPTVTVYVPIGEGKTLVERLRDGEGGRALYRAVGPVRRLRLRSSTWRRWIRAGAVARLEDGSFVLADVSCIQGRWGRRWMSESGGVQFI